MGFGMIAGQKVFYLLKPLLVEENGLLLQSSLEARRNPVCEVDESGVFLVRAPGR